MAYYRQPKFYRDFHCMGGSCPNSCCAIWRIDWTKEEVEKLKSAECSPELRALVETSFIQRPDTENMMAVKTEAANHFECPFLDKDRMCRIQRELGEEYLSYTCTVYPRSTFYSNNVMYRTCSASCYQVMKMICEDDSSMQLFSAPLEAKTVTVRYTPDSPETLKLHPELKYRNELFEFFYDIIGNTKRSLETSVLLGALAAQKLTQYIQRGEADRIPEIIKALRPQLNATSVPSFENAKTNYGICFGLVGKIVDIFENSNILDSLKINGKLSPQLLEQGRTIVNKYIENKPYIMRNIALNFMIEGKIPFSMLEFSLFENYCYFASTIAAVKLISSAIAVKDQDVLNEIYISVSYHVRGMYHSMDVNPQKVLDVLNENGCNSPAFIALMLK